MNSVAAPLRLAGVHLQPYNEIVRPGQVWKISKYFLRRWTPYLPASHVWLVIGARQESYFNGNRPWFTAYDAQLAAAAGIHVRSYRRSAKKEIVEGEGALATFIHKVGDPAYVRGQPVPKQEETRYEIRLDDPLTPADAAHLAFWLRRHAPQRVTAQAVAELLADAREEPVGELRAPEPEPEPPGPEESRLLTVADVTARVFPGVADASSWREAADRLHTHIVEPQLFHLESQYLRQQWVSELGPGPALLFVYLRSLCYHNPQTGESRDEVALQSGTLEQLFQKSSVTLRAWFSRLEEMVGESHPHGPFLQVVSTEKLPTQQVETTYRLNPLTPLHPDHLDRYRRLLETETGNGAGVKKDLSATSPEGNESFVSHVTQGEERFVSHVDGGRESSVSHVPEGNESFVPHAGRGEQSFVSRWPKKWQPYKYYKDFLARLEPEFKTLFVQKTSQQQHAWKLNDQQAALPFAAAAFSSIEGLLDTFGVQGQMRQRLRHCGLSLEAISAWYLYAEREEGLAQPARYMMKQAASGEPPPEPFLQLAQLTWEEWRIYAAAGALRPWLDPALFGSLAQAPLFPLWHDLYGEEAPDDLPAGVGEGLADLAEQFREAEALTAARDDDDARAAPDEEACAQWQATLQELELQMTKATFTAWLRDTRCLRREGDTFVVEVRSESARAWLVHRMQGMIERTLATVVGQTCTVRFVVAAR